jgi:hypothetical protein
MIVAIMQPYFFPYLGYWQLIQAVDSFILFDDAQYMRHGWINRNRILKPGLGWQYIIAPLEKHHRQAVISDVQVKRGTEWKDRILRQLEHYKKKSSYFDETMDIVNKALYAAGDDLRVSAINMGIIRTICVHLSIDTRISLSSEYKFDYSQVSDPGEWALHMCLQTKADEYVNPISGSSLFDPSKFSAAGIRLSFLESMTHAYSQKRPHESGLSVIDSLMFNGVEGTRMLLDQYVLKTAT